tara:strand:- start:70 stop:303 length:234 start_codon:yes stop_codon:yes gene_type:complete
VIVNVAVVLSESYRCLSVSEVVTIVAETVTEIAIVSIPRSNYAVLTFCLGDLLISKFVVTSVALIVIAIEVVRRDHD